VPPGKKRVSQEIQLTGEETWLDSGIEVQAGEHVLLTATGKLRYADAKEDNGPDGLAADSRIFFAFSPSTKPGAARSSGASVTRTLLRRF